MYGLGKDSDLGAYSDPSLSQIRRGIESYLKENPRSSVRFKSIIAHNDPIKQFEFLNARFNNGKVEIVNHGDHYQVDITRKIKRSGRVVEGSFAIFNHEDTQVWTAITAHGSDFFERGLGWVINNSEPHISEFYATSRDLETVLDLFSESINYDSKIIVTQAVAYSHREEGEISYKTRPYPEVFRAARDGGNYVDSLVFKSISESEVNLEATITRDGTTKLSSGNVELFFNYLLEDYVSFGQEKAELFTDRERSRDTGDIQEIEIKFANPVFQSTKDNENLINALGDLSQSSVTVYHKNPYAHISILDFNDGSSCDVFITDSKTIKIVPSYRGSTNFLMRISDKLYTDLDESDVELMEKPSYGVEDFVGG
jgi:hypothetical protein